LRQMRHRCTGACSPLHDSAAAASLACRKPRMAVWPATTSSGPSAWGRAASASAA
jgi:hypothetical protein